MVAFWNNLSVRLEKKATPSSVNGALLFETMRFQMDATIHYLKVERCALLISAGFVTFQWFAVRWDGILGVQFPSLLRIRASIIIG